MTPEIKTVAVPAGKYPIGGTDLVSKPAHQVEIAAFALGETVVNNAQFAAFIAADGYNTPSYWTPMGWRWQKNRQETQPAFWTDHNFNHDLQPVVGICWYEAMAFVGWLCAVTGQGWRLPSEVEWEAAARGHDYTAPPNNQINSAELGIRRTWAVIGRGQRSWCGALDMLGNIWEWTRSAWGRNWQTLDYHYPYDPTDGREDTTTSAARVMRGGSWFDARTHPAHRGRYLPGSRGSNIGFRLLLTY